jgi:dTDP-4-amino-4,6-dideoxygalactose transaminase
VGGYLGSSLGLRIDREQSMETQQLRSTIAALAGGHADRIAHSFPHREGKIALVENKAIDLAHVAELLAHCERCNQWANRGPLYWTLAEAYHAHMSLPDDIAVTPCANGGIALEALARFHQVKHGRPLRWVGSAFSFGNLGRGWFDGMRFVDCDGQGMLDLDALRALDPDTYDGFVVTNIFGLWRDFTPYIQFARTSGKAMLIDNAAGIDRQVPDWPYQSFSLHHTKPYGAGEGGLFLSPRDEAEAIYALLNFGPFDDNGPVWLNNGKLSDIACAFQLDRLAHVSDWAPRYREQAERIESIAGEFGLRPLVPGSLDRPAMNRPFLAEGEIPLERLRRSEKLHFGKYYNPLYPKPIVAGTFDRLVNIPTHPDTARLADCELKSELQRFVLGNS